MQRGWQVQGLYVVFQPDGQQPGVSGQEGPPPLKLINNALMYAKELERIV